MKGKAKFKVIDGQPVLLCSKCSTIIKYARFFTDEEFSAAQGKTKMGCQYCDECEEKRNKK